MIRKILLLIDGILLFLAFIVGIHYTCYIANVKYVDNTKTVILADIINLKTEDELIEIKNITPNTSYEKEFGIENLSDKDTIFNLLFKDITNEYENNLVYELYENDQLIVSQTVAPKSLENSYIKLKINLKSATEKKYKLKFTLLNRNNEDEIIFQNKMFSAKIEINSLNINDEIKTATNYLLANNTILEENMNEDINGLYKTNQTNNTLNTYYFKGNVENNYVNFNNELWQIIRINESGSIRIIKSENLNINYPFNNDSKLENSNDYLISNVKNELENYYNENLKQYDSMIVSENFCNELHVVKNDNFKIAEENMNYYEYTSTFNCNKENNSKIGLITYEEAIKAGLEYGKYNKNNYLSNGNNKNTWSISNAGVNSYTNDNYVWSLKDNGSIVESIVTNQNMSIRPVINLKSTLNVVGDGSIANPYVFTE